MTFCYSDIRFAGEFSAFNIVLRPTFGKVEVAFRALQEMLENKDILHYDLKEITAKSVEVRVQIRLNQIVWNNGQEICFKTKKTFLD